MTIALLVSREMAMSMTTLLATPLSVMMSIEVLKRHGSHPAGGALDMAGHLLVHHQPVASRDAIMTHLQNPLPRTAAADAFRQKINSSGSLTPRCKS